MLVARGTWRQSLAHGRGSRGASPGAVPQVAAHHFGIGPRDRRVIRPLAPPTCRGRRPPSPTVRSPPSAHGREMATAASAIAPAVDGDDAHAAARGTRYCPCCPCPKASEVTFTYPSPRVGWSLDALGVCPLGLLVLSTSLPAVGRRSVGTSRVVPKGDEAGS
jgi:hypothetical protein